MYQVNTSDTVNTVHQCSRYIKGHHTKRIYLPEHLSSPPFFSGVRVTRSLVLCVCFVDRCLSVCTFSFGHCVFRSSQIYGFCLPLNIFKLFFIQKFCYQTMISVLNNLSSSSICITSELSANETQQTPRILDSLLQILTSRGTLVSL